MATVPNEVEEIQRRMAAIRHELHEDVREVVANAEAVTDWQRYLRMYPWAGVTAAFAIGYLIVPRRRKKVPADLATQADVAQVREAVESAAVTARTPEPRRKSLLGTAWQLVGPLVIRTAQSYAAQNLENWILQQQQTAAGPASRQSSGTPGQGQPWGAG